MGGRNRRRCGSAIWGNNAKSDINIAPGNAQAMRVRAASVRPPIFSAMVLIVWVVLGPGRALQKAFISISSW